MNENKTNINWLVTFYSNSRGNHYIQRLCKILDLAFLFGKIVKVGIFAKNIVFLVIFDQELKNW